MYQVPGTPSIAARLVEALSALPRALADAGWQDAPPSDLVDGRESLADSSGPLDRALDLARIDLEVGHFWGPNGPNGAQILQEVRGDVTQLSGWIGSSM